MRKNILLGAGVCLCSVGIMTGCKTKQTMPVQTEISAEDEGDTASSQAEGTEEETEKTGNIEFTKEQLCAKDFTLYHVLCGSSELEVNTEGLELGLMQSVYDQENQTDPLTGLSWGYEQRNDMTAQKDKLGKEWNQTKWTIDEKAEYTAGETGIYYDFAVPEGNYEVTCSFYNPFNAKKLAVDCEGQTMAEQCKILKYQEKKVTFQQQITDGVLNLWIYNPDRGNDPLKNPMISSIVVKQLPAEYDAELLSCLSSIVMEAERNLKLYTRQTRTAFEEAYKEAETLASPGAAGKGKDYEEAYIKLKTAYDELEKIEVYHSFTPGEPWCDDDGTIIQAHGGHVQRLQVKDPKTGELVEKWWWVGEDKTYGYRGGICAYSSDDLYNWTYEGIIMRNISSREDLDTLEYFKTLYQGYTKEQLDNVYNCINDTTSVIERPKMIYNEKTGKYLLWFHADGPTETSDANYAAASAGVAVSDSPYGPFQFVDRYRLNVCPADQEDMYPESKGMARDMNLFIDDDKTAYIIYSSEENLTIYISKLNEEYTGLATPPEKAVYGEDFIRLFPGAQREAPALFKRNGIYYLMTSAATGWAPNQARYYMADSVMGEWTNLGDPCIDDKKQTTFDSQSTCIFCADEASDTYIYMGDRWNSDDLGNSRYIWLPIHFDAAGKMSIEWTDEWKLDKE